MAGTPNHPKLNNFSIEPRGFGDPPFLETFILRLSISNRF